MGLALVSQPCPALGVAMRGVPSSLGVTAVPCSTHSDRNQTGTAAKHRSALARAHLHHICQCQASSGPSGNLEQVLHWLWATPLGDPFPFLFPLLSFSLSLSCPALSFFLSFSLSCPFLSCPFLSHLPVCRSSPGTHSSWRWDGDTLWERWPPGRDNPAHLGAPGRSDPWPRNRRVPPLVCRAPGNRPCRAL